MSSRISSIILNNPSGFLDSFVSLMGFKFWESSIKSITGNSQKMSNNFTALFHAIVTSGLTFGYLFLSPNNESLYYVFKKFSTGYFLYDMIFCLKNLKSPLKYVYLYHHMASMYYINSDTLYSVEGVLASELSNIPSYIVYYLLKTKNPNVKLMKNIQFIIYSLIRLPLLGYYLYLSYKIKGNKMPVYAMTPVYIMGLIWTKSLYKQL